jgi:hypothetical protein
MFVESRTLICCLTQQQSDDSGEDVLMLTRQQYTASYDASKSQDPNTKP